MSDPKAVLGQEGYWLDSGDFVSTANLEMEHMGQLGFPRDWPNVYGSSKALKQLVGKKGKCAGKRVGVVPLPASEQFALVKGLQFHPLQSFSNAERAAKAAGIEIVRGWAVYEHLEKDVSEAFVAERFWWNSLEDGTWVDFTPRPKDIQEMLLAEAIDGAPKAQESMNKQQQKIMEDLLFQRFGVAKSPPSQPNPTNPTSPPATSQPKITTKIQQKAKTPITPSAAPQSLRELARRVQQGEIEAVRQLDEKLVTDLRYGWI